MTGWGGARSFDVPPFPPLGSRAHTWILANIIDDKTEPHAGGVGRINSAVTTVDGRVSAVDIKVNKIGGDVTTLDQKADTTLVGIRSLQSTLANDQALSFRLSMEQKLLQSGRGGIGTFALPAAQGGYLGEVRNIVADTIGHFRAAGQDLGNADGELARGDAAAGRKDYKFAFTAYRNAYRLAVQ